MNLDDFLDSVKYTKDSADSITVARFARKLGVTQIYLSSVRHGRNKCSQKLADAIEKASAGKVTAKECMQQKAWKKRQGIPMEE